MLDIRLFRENPEMIRESEKKRFKDPKIVDKVVEYDKKWRHVLKEVEKLRHRRNVVSREIAKLKKSGKDVRRKIKEMRKINDEIARKDEEAKKFLLKRDELRYRVGNILHCDVNLGNTEEENKIIRAWGKAKVW